MFSVETTSEKVTSHNQNNIEESMTILDTHYGRNLLLDKWYVRILFKYLSWAFKPNNIMLNNIINILIMVCYWLVFPTHWAVLVFVLIPVTLCTVWAAVWTMTNKEVVVSLGVLYSELLKDWENEKKQNQSMK